MYREKYHRTVCINTEQTIPCTMSHTGEHSLHTILKIHSHSWPRNPGPDLQGICAQCCVGSAPKLSGGLRYHKTACLLFISTVALSPLVASCL